VPGDLATPTGGYTYDRRMIAELQGLGWRVRVVDLGNGFPRPGDAALAAASVRLKALPRAEPIVVDGLAFGAIPEIAADLSHTHRVIALVHHPLALETGLSAPEADWFRRRERAALTCTDDVIVTSPATARLLADDYGVAPESITVVLPGSERRAPARQERGNSDGTISLLSVGAIIPRKGYDVLVAALAALADLPWRLTIAGDRSRDPETAARLDADIRSHGLAGRIDVLGAVTDARLDALYEAADLFVLASRFEGYGMAYAEALANGLPVVGTTAGAIVETVPDGAGLLVPPDDVVALTQALRRLIGDAHERARRASAARSAAASLPSWRAQAELFARAVEKAGGCLQ
jgi:glycosyltransferase involved in cell wall biosynthesis